MVRILKSEVATIMDGDRGARRREEGHGHDAGDGAGWCAGRGEVQEGGGLVALILSS